MFVNAKIALAASAFQMKEAADEGDGETTVAHRIAQPSAVSERVRFDRDEDCSFRDMWKQKDFQNRLKAQVELIAKEKDDVGKSGSTVVIGTLSETIKGRIRKDVHDVNAKMQTTFPGEWQNIKLRDSDYWHITIYGVFNSSDAMEQSVEKNVKRAEAIKDSLIKNMKFPEFDITYDGLGMLGSGLISGRIHDSSTIDLMRDAIERTCKRCSRQLSYYNPITGDFSGYVVNKIIVGTIKPMQGDHEVMYFPE
ncbi:hypothetical protein CYMTET_46600 [Cymbomonas tetramitiformis]|uniref:Uncharacterized protein n=1 Tax=Cymbomonas tetramitiformis TaxID=36881 RepID=A0AAE0BXN0_9CHLO|nr:hypothetical protein CYMTET_46600 [Cymbomonas tetramitiformis]